MFDSIIFDMDGTLIDSVKQIKEAWNLTIKKYGWNKVCNTKDIKSIMGLTPSGMAKIIFPSIDNAEGTRRLTICTLEEIEYLRKHKVKTYIPDEKFLKQLAKKYKLFIVSNCLEGYIESFYDAYGYGKYFIDFANASNGKTKGQNIKDIVEKHKLINPVYIGDTMGDYNSSKEAGVDFIYASYGFGKVDNVKKINKLEELLNEK